MFAKGVSRRWLVNTIGVVFLILVISITTISVMVQSSTYNGIELALTGRSDELLNWLSSSATLTSTLWLYRRGAGLYREVPRQEQHGNYGPGPERQGVYHLHRF